MATINYRIDKLPKSVTLMVDMRTSKQFKVRTWIAMNLIRLATWVLGCGVRFEDGTE